MPYSFLHQAHSTQTYQLMYLQNYDFMSEILFSNVFFFYHKLESSQVFNPLEWQQSKCLKVPTIDKDVEQREFFIYY